MTTGKLSHTLDFVRSMNLPEDDYAIFGSGPLMIRGIKDRDHLRA